MTLKLLSLISGLLGSAFGITCFNFVCDTLDSGVCAKRTDDNTAIINDNCGCGIYYSDLYYNLTIDYPYFGYFKTQLTCDYDTGSIYKTSDKNTSLTIDCKNRLNYTNSTTELDSRDYPFMCDDDNDCIREDGLFEYCKCALDGNAYCNINLITKFYDDLWDECDGGDVDELYYWVWYSYFYPMQVNTPSCADNIIYELIYLNELNNERPDSSHDNASELVFSVLGVLAFLY